MDGEGPVCHGPLICNNRISSLFLQKSLDFSVATMYSDIMNTKSRTLKHCPTCGRSLPNGKEGEHVWRGQRRQGDWRTVAITVRATEGSTLLATNYTSWWNYVMNHQDPIT